MKQKNLKYTLVATVALVWGLILYKVVNGIGNKDIFIPLTASQKKINYDAPVDSFSLMADYPDPFIAKEGAKDEVADPTPPPKGNTPIIEVTAAAPPKSLFDPSIIQYEGMIANPENKIKVAILTISGREYLAKEKERVNEYKIKSIGKDLLIIIYKGISYTIERVK